MFATIFSERIFRSVAYGPWLALLMDLDFLVVANYNRMFLGKQMIEGQRTQAYPCRRLFKVDDGLVETLST